MSKPILVGCINGIHNSIFSTRFFYVSPADREVRDVTKELCVAISEYNIQADLVNRNGGYAMTIPYTFKNKMAYYSFGCGLTHYLQENMFESINMATDYMMSFPLSDCRLAALTADDLKNILNVDNVWDIDLIPALKSYYDAN